MRKSSWSTNPAGRHSRRRRTGNAQPPFPYMFSRLAPASRALPSRSRPDRAPVGAPRGEKVYIHTRIWPTFVTMRLLYFCTQGTSANKPHRVPTCGHSFRPGTARDPQQASAGSGSQQRNRAHRIGWISIRPADTRTRIPCPGEVRCRVLRRMLVRHTKHGGAR